MHTHTLVSPNGLRAIATTAYFEPSSLPSSVFPITNNIRNTRGPRTPYQYVLERKSSSRAFTLRSERAGVTVLGAAGRCRAERRCVGLCASPWKDAANSWPSRLTASTRQDSGPSRTLATRNVSPSWCSYQHRKSPACDVDSKSIFPQTECGASSQIYLKFNRFVW